MNCDGNDDRNRNWFAVWTLEPHSDGSFGLRHYHTDQVMDVEHASTHQGARIMVHPEHHRDNQRFYIKRALSRPHLWVGCSICNFGTAGKTWWRTLSVRAPRNEYRMPDGARLVVGYTTQDHVVGWVPPGAHAGLWNPGNAGQSWTEPGRGLTVDPYHTGFINSENGWIDFRNGGKKPGTTRTAPSCRAARTSTTTRTTSTRAAASARSPTRDSAITSSSAPRTSPPTARAWNSRNGWNRGLRPCGMVGFFWTLSHTTWEF
ncbi:RICIN domain-containing protein [Streptomyces roseifaciens]|uniref:RICIN domain-containing protein n=1 Tax=Streptomyces roseifaciens TaxID=1488406 RepID=UPI000717F8E8|nr:RICIN domain-containing protein [Streptomyces roseifaciens]